jgi:uncharacterized membrane protein YdbT with pleckstrin-like domain
MSAEFDWVDLETDEEVLWADTPHPYSLLPAFIVGIPLSVLVVGIVIIASAYMTYKNTNYVVTTDALYKKTGVFSRNVKRIEFAKVQDTSYSQSFLGTQFGFGVVEVSTAGGGSVELRFKDVSEPQSLQSLINKRLRQQENRDSTADEKAVVLDEILDELRALRRLVENTDSDTEEAEHIKQRTAEDGRADLTGDSRAWTDTDKDDEQSPPATGDSDCTDETDQPRKV